MPTARLFTLSSSPNHPTLEPASQPQHSPRLLHADVHVPSARGTHLWSAGSAASPDGVIHLAKCRYLWWARVESSTAKSSNAQEDVKEKMIPLEHVSAVVAGAKTELAKKMLKRSQKGGGGVAGKMGKMFGSSSSELHDECCFSLISAERTLDFYADSK